MNNPKKQYWFTKNTDTDDICFWENEPVKSKQGRWSVGRKKPLQVFNERSCRLLFGVKLERGKITSMRVSGIEWFWVTRDKSSFDTVDIWNLEYTPYRQQGRYCSYRGDSESMKVSTFKYLFGVTPRQGSKWLIRLFGDVQK